MRNNEIAQLLRRALLEGGAMVHALYEYELKEHIDHWYKGLKKDHDDFVFVVTENAGHVAMLLIMADKTVYINEEAREKLQAAWPDTYQHNLQLFIPVMADDLANGFISVNGVRTPAAVRNALSRKNRRGGNVSERRE